MSIKTLKLPEIKVIKFARFSDHRGYFTELYRKNDFLNHPELEFIKEFTFLQCNESFSKKHSIRGLHFQWNPYVGKLVRTISGHMVDLILDIRKGSPYWGKIIAYDMPIDNNNDFSEWIWVPPGFAHGNFFLKDSIIEYLCTGEYNSNCESGISPLSQNFDWSLCDTDLKKLFQNISLTTDLITDKDNNGLTINEWLADARSDNFIYKNNIK